MDAVVLRATSRGLESRWVVIADRYNAATTTLRSVEDIKYRYYEVTRLLGEYRDRVAGQLEQDARDAAAVKQEAPGESDAMPIADATPERTSVSEVAPTPGAEPAKPVTTLLTPASDRFYVFNVAYEKQRKQQLELAFARSLDDENEIKRLTDELRTVEQQLKKAAVKVDTKKKKELADVPFAIARELPTGVLLRSSLLALPQHKYALSSKLVKKMELMLDELGVPVRPMPTKDTCELYDTLRKDVVGLLSLRKHLAAKQTEAQLLKDRFKSLTGSDFQPVSTPVRRTGTTENESNERVEDRERNSCVCCVEVQIIGVGTCWQRLERLHQRVGTQEEAPLRHQTVKVR